MLVGTEMEFGRQELYHHVDRTTQLVSLWPPSPSFQALKRTTCSYSPWIICLICCIWIWWIETYTAYKTYIHHTYIHNMFCLRQGGPQTDYVACSSSIFLFPLPECWDPSHAPTHTPVFMYFKLHQAVHWAHTHYLGVMSCFQAISMNERWPGCSINVTRVLLLCAGSPKPPSLMCSSGWQINQ